MKKIAIDIGSNSILFLGAEVGEGKILKVFEDISHITSLGKGLHTQSSLDSISRDNSFKVLKDYVEIAKKWNVQSKDIIVTATEALRVASDGPLFIERCRDELGLNIELISGEEEGLLTARGVLSGSIDNLKKKTVIIDIGGSSTELIYINDSEIKACSYPIGAVKATDMKNDLKIHAIIKDSKDFIEIEALDSDDVQIIGVAGTIVALSCIAKNITEYNENHINGCLLNHSGIENVQSRLKDQSTKKDFEFLEKRIPFLHYGSVVLAFFLESLKKDSLLVSTRGLRHGAILNRP